MSSNEQPREFMDSPIYLLLQQLRDGTQDPTTVTKDLRQDVVELLLAEGHSVLSMAQILKRSEKTIKRDIEDIRERNALSPDINLAKSIVGELLMYARVNRDHLMKLARTKDSSVSEKAQAEYLAFKVISEMVVRMQSLGYMPSRPQAVVGDIFHHVGEDGASLDDIDRQIIELGRVADGDDEVSESIKVDVERMKKLVTEIKAQKEPNTQEDGNGQS